MKFKTFLITAFVFFIAVNLPADVIKDNNYKFEITLPSGWGKPTVEETSKKDAISYSISRTDDKCAILLIAFKVNSIKDLTDFVYTLEKDVTLNIPLRDGSYSNFDKVSYDGMSANYRDDNFSETIYYFRTKYTDTKENYAYLLRFITPWAYNDSEIQSEIARITESFKPLR